MNCGRLRERGGINRNASAYGAEGCAKVGGCIPHAELYLNLISRALHILMRRLFKQDFSRVDDTGKMMEPSQVQRKHKCCPQILLYSGVVGALLVLLFMLTVGGAIGASTVSHTRSLKLENSSLLALGGGISVHRGVMAHPGFGLEIPLLLACRSGVGSRLGLEA